MTRYFMNQFSTFQFTRPVAVLAALTMACAGQGQTTSNATGELTTSPQPLSPSGDGTSQPVSPGGERSGAELSWPREFEDSGIKVSIFKPQIEKWEGTAFE